MATTSSSFSNRAWHTLNFTVTRTTSGSTSTFVWSATITTTSSSYYPYGTGTYNHSTSPATTYVSGNTNNATNFSYDYRSNNTYTINLGSGTRTAPADGTSYTFSLSVSMGSLIGSATASITIAAGSSTPAPTAPTYLNASTNSSDGIDLSWGGATGTIANYGIWWNTSSSGAPSAASTPDFTTPNTSYTDSGAGQGNTRYYWVRAQNGSLYSAWYPSGGTGVTGTQIVPITYYNVSFTNSYGSNGTPSTQSIASGSSTSFPNPGSRSGYTFTGWNNNSNYTPGSQTPAITGPTSYTADTGWVALAPGFTDETVTSQLVINQPIESTANSSVSASNTTSYSLQSAGSGLNPLSWLSINASTGALTGSTNAVGQYTFRVVATGISTTSYSNTITINVVYPGKRINSSFSQAAMNTARRWDGSQWVALTQMKRWNGSSWVNITN